jgi:hypothetical protein
MHDKEELNSVKHNRVVNGVVFDGVVFDRVVFDGVLFLRIVTYTTGWLLLNLMHEFKMVL